MTELTKQRTFAEIVEQFENSDELLADPNFDPVAMVGELKSKVDRLYFFDEWVKGRHAYFQDVASQFQAVATALKKNREKFREYCASVMAENSVIEYPGDTKRITLIGGEPIPPAFEITHAADERAHLKFPDFCKAEVSVVYRWDMAAIRKAQEAGTLPDGIGRMSEPGRTKAYVKFFNNNKPKPKTKKVSAKNAIS